MRKSLFFAAFACVALASCVTDDASENNQEVKSPQKITFNAPVVSGITRAVAGENPNTAGGSYNTTESFAVYAVWHDEDFNGWNNGSIYMDNVNVIYDGGNVDEKEGTGAWFPATDYYWPKDGYLTFAAYSPADAKGTKTYGATGLKIENFEVETDATKQYDLMFSKRTYKRYSSLNDDNPTYDGVNIVFVHALSSIQFAVKTEGTYTGTEIKLKKISLWGVNSKGTFNETIDETTPSTYNSTPEWSDHSEVITNTNAYVAYNNTTGLVVENTQQALNGGANQTDLILMPQKIPTTGTVRIDYSIKSTSGVEIDQVAEIEIDDYTKAWEYNTRYTYTIVIGLDKIYFAPTVEAWTDVNVNSEIKI